MLSDKRLTATRIVVSAACFLLIAGASAHAAIITFPGTGLDLTGQGFGNAPPILTVQALGSTTTEWGAVTWDGSDDVLSGDASKNKSQTVTAGSLLDDGVTRKNFGMLFNINEPGSAEDLTVFQFSVDFYSPTGTLLLSANFDGGAGGLNLVGYDHGQGKAGWLFAIDLSQSEYDTVFGNRNNRVGMTIPSDHPMTDVFGGAEDFRVGAATPEPGTLALLALGGVMVAVRRKR